MFAFFKMTRGRRHHRFGRTPSAIRFKRRRISANRETLRRKGLRSRLIYRTRGVTATGETKYAYVDAVLAIVVVSNAWTGTEIDPVTQKTLFFPTQGPGVSQRIGLTAFVHKISIRGTVIAASQINQTAGSNPTLVRVILYQDMQTNATQAQGEQVMQNLGVATENVFSYQNLGNFGRFKVIKDIILKLENPNMVWDGTNIETNGVQKLFKFNCKFQRPVLMHFNQTNGATIADIIDNSFHMLAIASDGTLNPKIYYNCKTTFKG